MRLNGTKATSIHQYRGLGDQLWDLGGSRPSLDLNFSHTKSLVDGVTGKSLVDFTRASSGTYVGSDGLLKTAATNEPRFDHNPTTGESLGLLVEEQRTNLLLRSEEFDNASWVKSAATSTGNAATSPDGTNTADVLAENTLNSTHIAFQSYTYTAATHTQSIFAKAAGRTFVRLVMFDGVTSFAAYFNLSTGAIGNVTGTGATASITSFGNGWYRCCLIATTAAGAGNIAIRIATANGTDSYTGDGTSGIYIWGAQLEAGAFPTSYIPTTTAAATRSADVCSISGSNFSSWFNTAGGTIFSESDRNTSISSSSTVCSVNDGTFNNRFLNARQDSSTVLAALSVTGGVTDGSAQTTGLSSANPRNRIAIAQYVNDLAVTSNATAPVSDTSVAIPTVTQLQIGSVTNASYYNGTIRRLTYWPARLPNSTLQAITQ